MKHKARAVDVYGAYYVAPSRKGWGSESAAQAVAEAVNVYPRRFRDVSKRLQLSITTATRLRHQIDAHLGVTSEQRHRELGRGGAGLEGAVALLILRHGALLRENKRLARRLVK